MKKKGFSKRVLLCGMACLAVVVAVVWLAYLLHKQYEETVVSQTQQQLLMSARSITVGIEGFVQGHSDELKTISRNPAIQERAYKSILVKEPPTGHCVCQDLYEVQKDHVDAFTLLDAKGIMLRRLPHWEERIGRDHSDKPGVAYVLRERKAHVSEAFYNHSGNLVISILEPVFYDDEFAGIVLWMIQVDTISRCFVEMVETRREAYVWMFDDKHIVLAHPRKEFIGMPVLDFMRKVHQEGGQPFDEAGLEEHISEEHDYLNRVEVEEEGYGTFVGCLTGNDELTAYKRVAIGDRNWNLIVRLPYSEIAGPIREHARNTFGLAGVIILLFALAGVVFFRIQKRKAQLETETKYLKQVAKSAEALRESKEKLAGVVKSVTDVMIMVDEQFNVVWINDVAKDQFGPDLVGKKCYSAYQGRTEVCEPCIVKQCFEDGKVHEFETEITGSNGNHMVFWCKAGVAAWRTDARPSMVVEFLRDITDRKRAEEKVKAALGTAEDERLKSEAIIEGIGEPLSIIDTDFRFIFQNKVHRDSYGEHIGEHCYKAIKNRDEVCEGCQLAESFSDGKIHTKERIVPREDGPLYVVNTTSPLRDSTGEIIAGIEIIRDITELKRSEEMMRQSEGKLNAMLQSIGDHMSMMDKDLNIIWANEIATKLFGDDIIGKKCFEAYHGRKEPCEPYPCLTLKAFQDGKVHEHDTQVIGKDGKIMYFHCTANVALRDEKGKPTAVIEISRDTTESKRAEEEREKLEAQLLQAQKMEAIGTLTGGISHDFNNILQAISGYTQLLLMKKEGDNPESRYLNQIDKSVQRANELTQQLLTFSRKVESKLRPVDLNQEVIQANEVLIRTIPKMIDIELNLAKNPKLINADPLQLEQIMMNLGVNAKDAMPDGGKLIFQTEEAVLDKEYCATHLGATPGKYTLLTISDTGHGMDKETVQRIFEPFYTTKETGKGTGLGLAMVYGIVKSHGGYIACYSEPGHGTVFRVYFPVLETESREQRAECKEDEEIVGGSETILLVDDEDTLLDLGQDMLQRYGYTAITAESGEKGIETYKLEKGRIDLVILDIGMPGMGGHKCLQELLRIDPEIKVIIASGYPKDAKVKEMLESGAAGFIGKPYDLMDILNKVREVLGGK